MHLLTELKHKINSYSIRQIYRYTGVSNIRITLQLCKYMTYRLLGIRYAVAKVNDYLMRVDFKTPGLSKVLFIYGTRELPDTYVAQNIITPGMVVADIGANIGYYTLLAAQRVEDSGHVYAFEPDPRNINLLRDNLTLNGLTHRVTIYEQAVSNTSEKKIFQLGERSNVSSFVDRPDVVGAVEVDCIALHQFPHIDKIDMLRMDAEGYECKIIAGALPYFRTTKRPFTIMLEVHPEAYDDQEFNFAALLNELFALGFSVSHSIAGSNFKAAYEARGYRSRGHWVETKHPCELFTDIKNVDAQYFLEHAMIRAMVIKRDAQKNRGE